MLLYVVFSDLLPPSSPEPVSPYASLPSSELSILHNEYQQLVQEFAPIVMLHPDERKQENKHNTVKIFGFGAACFISS